MNKYQLLKNNEDTIYQFVKNGILSYQIIRDISIFEDFNKLESHSNIKNVEVRYSLIGDEYELSSKRIEQIILQMQKDII
ncbi:hypothetical protein [Flavobacterium capsici]|uniref:Uncharacterized protein n=1 Tax=Flavobacterium capsici TaxID=3075618 RepID=A0AA96J1Q5_9FLAO|nr:MULTISPECIES: hypothetical protein [unclassified Flavobacterium]WNM18627.1 hypothetical protein RN608_11475 [Flavobacterium sp. PMR2A8]WNM22678.1 hypothetical protein RN605_04775 [Flavobacterium sp. PMTSA4]